MEQAKKIIGLFGVLAILFSLNSCFSYEEVEFRGISNLDVKQLSLQGLAVDLEAEVYNPNGYKITITDYDLDLYIGDKNMGKAEIDRKLVLPKKSQKNHPFSVQVSFTNLLSGGLAGGLAMLGKDNLDLTVKGHIKAKAMGVKKTVPIEFSESVSMR